MGQLTDAIRDAVERSEESLSAIARGAGVNKSQLSRLLSGERGLSIDSAERVADYLRLEIIVRPKRRGRKGK